MKTKASAAVALVMMAMVGCTLTQSELRKNGLLPTVGGHAGKDGTAFLPKRCALKFMIVTKPVSDTVMSNRLWTVVDDQVLPDATREALAANGLRAGVVTGELPPEVQEILNAPPPNRIDPALVIISSGENTLVEMGAASPSLDLIVNRDGKAVGKVYDQAKGCLRLTPKYEENHGVGLRIVPELHHGPITRSWSAVQGTTFDPKQLTMKDGQTEETYRELAAELNLLPGQVAVVGGQSDKPGSLGNFLFTATEVKSDRLLQRVLFIWASRAENDAGSPSPDTESALPPGLKPVDPPEMPEMSDQ
jgi:hypothetical protein